MMPLKLVLKSTYEHVSRSLLQTKRSAGVGREPDVTFCACAIDLVRILTQKLNTMFKNR